MTERTKRRLFTVVTFAIGIVLGLVVVEIGLRIIGVSSPEFYTADWDLGYRLIPNTSGTYSSEGRSYVVINSEGFRDVEHAIEKPANTVRIAVVGDSYVEGLQVEQNERFTDVLQSHLNACDGFGGKQVELLTFGVSGYGTGQELLLIQRSVLKYSPDIIMLLMT